MTAKTIHLKETDSTNSVAYSLAEDGVAHGTAVVAEYQSLGRGRLGKSWQSPANQGLYCSFVIRPNLATSDYPLITMSAGLGVALALEETSALEFSLKWPNDIYRNGRKCGGILVESSPLTNHHKEHFVVVGVGLNVNNRANDFPQEIGDKATSLYIEGGKVMDKQVVFEVIRGQLLYQLQRLEGEGFAGILKQWSEKDMLVGKQLSWVTRLGEVVEGLSLGPDSSGRLHVKDKSGVIHEVLSGDISLSKTA